MSAERYKATITGWHPDFAVEEIQHRLEALSAELERTLATLREREQIRRDVELVEIAQRTR